jgi:hypothetical protein
VKKIPTLFLRDADDMRFVTREPHPDCGWVFAGEGVPTVKYDGTCVMFDGDRWWARREVKPGKATPPGYVAVETDEITGKTVGWEPIELSSFAKLHAEALVETRSGISHRGWPAGTYELVGPKINGNPERIDAHCLWAHSAATVLTTPRDYGGLAAFLAKFDGEGIVWHHPDGRMAKIKRRDFPRQETGDAR